ncbi:STAS domain-containing protein [Kibdelosporangium persicum]|uniref:Anti-sigma factor antagonist n=1 Tax=Kibdelosporangium persicum TaxID=2698649 RepID=A0ABX2F1D7_9PSEU|nr:STAS domain-containing protein [Kibdelosporangium persicum]NRN65138.1 Anti-sigma B factor antagonist [Kibdelosporangium persicum]
MSEQQDHARLHCRVEQREETVVISVSGAIDLATQATFAETIQRAFQGDEQAVVIDLTGVTFLASPGLAVLVEAQENAMRAQKDLRVAVGNDTVKRSIEITGLAQILSLAPDLRAALDN